MFLCNILSIIYLIYSSCRDHLVSCFSMNKVLFWSDGLLFVCFCLGLCMYIFEWYIVHYFPATTIKYLKGNNTNSYYPTPIKLKKKKKKKKTPTIQLMFCRKLNTLHNSCYLTAFKPIKSIWNKEVLPSHGK